MDILIKTTRISSINKKYQRGDSFRTYLKKVKKSSPRMGWFRASVKVEILNVHWPFITLWSNEGQFYWWIKLKKLLVFKEKENNQVICRYYIPKKKVYYSSWFFNANNIISDPFIQNLKRKPNMVHDLSRQMKISLKKHRLENSVKNQIHQIIRITSKNGRTEYHGSKYAKNDVVLEPGWISDDFELSEPEFYQLVTTVTRDDDGSNIYTVTVEWCDIQISVDESKYEDIHHNELIFPGGYISKKEPIKISEKNIIEFCAIQTRSSSLIASVRIRSSFLISSLWRNVL